MTHGIGLCIYHWEKYCIEGKRCLIYFCSVLCGWTVLRGVEIVGLRNIDDKGM